MNIIAFAASSSKNSINKKLITYIANSHFEGNNIEILDLNDYEMPIYSIDKEKESGIHQLAIDFAKKIDQSDLILISFAEHNGNYATAFKNIFDWVSRIKTRKMFGEKPMFITATSPGARGGLGVLEIAANRIPRSSGTLLGMFSLPSFNETFDPAKGILNETLKAELEQKILIVKNLLKEQGI